MRGCSRIVHQHASQSSLTQNVEHNEKIPSLNIPCFLPSFAHKPFYSSWHTFGLNSFGQGRRTLMQSGRVPKRAWVLLLWGEGQMWLLIGKGPILTFQKKLGGGCLQAVGTNLWHFFAVFPIPWGEQSKMWLILRPLGNFFLLYKNSIWDESL